MNLPTITGQVPHDVEQCILQLRQAVEELQAEVARLRTHQSPTNAVART